MLSFFKSLCNVSLYSGHWVTATPTHWSHPWYLQVGLRDAIITVHYRGGYLWEGRRPL